MATARPNRVSVARKTSPMPPSPSLCSIRYGPRQAPDANSVTVTVESSSPPPVGRASSDSTSRRNSGSALASSAARALPLALRADWYSSSICRDRSGLMAVSLRVTYCKLKFAQQPSPVEFSGWTRFARAPMTLRKLRARA